MNTLPHLRKTIGLASVVGLGLGFLAGTGQANQLQHRPSPVQQAGGMASGDSDSGGEKMDCPACRTGTFRKSKHVGPPSKGHNVWFDASVQHMCSRCGMGTISVIDGRTIHSMTHACALCGKEAAGCVAAAQAEAAKIADPSPGRIEPKRNQPKQDQ